MSPQFGVGFLNYHKPSLIVAMKNSSPSKRFQNIVAAYSYTNGIFGMDWNWTDGFFEVDNFAEGHHFRIADVDFNGIDEIHQIGYVFNGNGTIRFNLHEKMGIRHGDRFYVAKFAKNDLTMSGYGIQQDNPDLIYEYSYNASTGDKKWIHYGDEIHDVGRGNAGDFDPNHEGYEVFSFMGLYNAKTNEKIADNISFWPANNVFWDGTLNPSIYNSGYLTKWNYEINKGTRLYSAYSDFNNKYRQYPVDDDTGEYPLFHGDILGDWREEFIMACSNYSELVIFTTNLDTNLKLTTLWHDPGMRASMTLNGYKQSHMPLEYLGTETDPLENRRNLVKYHKLRAESEIEPTNEPETMKITPTQTPVITNTSPDQNNGKAKNKTAAIVVPIVLVLIAVICVVSFFVWKRFAKKESTDNVQEMVLIV
ncbi:rhamnogalacturonan lyase, putative [Trichomonas vaginalis G3]|uniref:Rhamnogalacturonan lyase, putative n=1 Tax=Trichomonas vaginalis (strain ATCC PRA-98 / G3) TaxID=412133 RepID=A2EPU4_TRIV3|nr:rhamnogalacturonan lyase, putative [Trichomonas vaginalis G3]|eukprot:XP_001317578.1 rhamnogalacturonan lyase [Trichomonas vaginalis G3]